MRNIKIMILKNKHFMSKVIQCLEIKIIGLNYQYLQNLSCFARLEDEREMESL